MLVPYLDHADGFARNGAAEVQVGEERRLVGENEAVFVPLGAVPDILHMQTANGAEIIEAP